MKEDTGAASPDTSAKGKDNEAVLRVSVSVEDDAPAPSAEGTKRDSTETPATNGLLKDKTENQSPRPSTESITSAPPRQSLGARQSLQVVDSSNRPSEDSASRVNQILNDADREEEIHGYIERIDALQAKLNYLAKESAESARKAAAEAGQGTLQKKLAEKDEQIALLMEEGQKLSKTELKHMTAIKRLRASTAQVEKEGKISKERLDKSEKEKTSLAERFKRLETESKQSAQNSKRIAQLERDLEAQRAENKSKNETVEDLKKQLKEAASQATGEEVKKLTAELKSNRSRINDLEEEVSSEKIERELVEEKLQAREKELNAKMEREAERARVAEVELKSEIQVLEGRLEIMRSRAEEVSSGATGDAQAKLLRQIETLQSQYAVASENWQGIESSLTSRVTALSKERDEALKREGETRKKAREMVSILLLRDSFECRLTKYRHKKQNPRRKKRNPSTAVSRHLAPNSQPCNLNSLKSKNWQKSAKLHSNKLRPILRRRNRIWLLRSVNNSKTKEMSVDHQALCRRKVHSCPPLLTDSTPTASCPTSPAHVEV